jgi:hypothetical protein
LDLRTAAMLDCLRSAAAQADLQAAFADAAFNPGTVLPKDRS